MESKICYKCKAEKPLSEFDIVKKNGKPHSYCKDCRRQRNLIASKAYYKKHKETRMAYQSNKRNTDAGREQARNFKRKHIERLSDCYVVSCLVTKTKLTTEEIRSIPGLIEAEKTRLLLHRKIKNHGSK